MKKTLLLFIAVFTTAFTISAQSIGDPWNAQQLLSTKTLADRITKNNMKNTVVINIGPDVTIKNSYNIGAGNDVKNIEKLQSYLKTVDKNKEIVIYCGCCPMDVCPNIRPAFKTVINAGFKKVKLLNIPKNIKVDWIDKGYPVN